MVARIAIEQSRLALQAKLDAERSGQERNKLGQFATPTALASDILAYARTLIPTKRAIRFLDPAFGTGAFYSALLKEFGSKHIEQATAFEIDPHYGQPARRLWRDNDLKLILADFTTANPPAENEKFNLVICNPPYVRHHHMDRAVKERLHAATVSASGMKMAGLAGLYGYFLGLSHSWIANGGVAGWLIPSEFMDVNYGVPIKRYLLNEVELIRVHRFDPNDLQFGDALVSSAIVWFRKGKPAKNHEVIFSYGGSLSKPKLSRTIPLASLDASAKWTSIASDGVRAATSGLRLSDFFDVKRGLATGDNKFFIMTQEQIKTLGLPKQFFKPILPGPRYLETDIIEAKVDGTPNIERQLFMLDCRIPEPELKVQYPELWAYLRAGKETISKTYLCSRRKPWYLQERRPPAPFVCTYMGRNMAKREKPFRFILNKSSATAANVYLLLYPKPVMARALKADPSLDHRIWKFLEGIDAATLLGEGRVYGGGLYKMEPRELGNVPADAIAAMLPEDDRSVQKQTELFDVQAA